MHLGTIITALQDETNAAATLLALGNIVLLAKVDAARQPFDESIGAYVSGATRRFEKLASDEDWLALMTALERSDNPAATCITRMVSWSLARDSAVETKSISNNGCSCGHGHTGLP
jgi:hypothetical protein